jgi:hypothetical protein
MEQKKPLHWGFFIDSKKHQCYIAVSRLCGMIDRFTIPISTVSQTYFGKQYLLIPFLTPDTGTDLGNYHGCNKINHHNHF